jgi:integrase
MTTKRLGSAEWSGKTVSFRLSYDVDPKRTRLDLRDYLGDRMSTDRDAALEQGRKVAHEMSLEGRAKNAGRILTTSGSANESVLAWADRWHDMRLARHMVEDDTTDRSLIRNHLEPVIGRLPMRLVTRSHIEAIVERLDRLVVEGDLSWKSAANAWAVVRAMFRDAVNSKEKGLRVRADDPTSGVEPPERGEKRATTILYPSEYLQLTTAPAIWQAEGAGRMRAAMMNRRKAARRWMRLFTIAIYLQMRAGEIRAMQWEGIDLEHRVIEIHKAARPKTRGKVLKEPKKGSTRTFEIPVEAVPLLAAMRDEAKLAQGVDRPTGPIIAVPPEETLAAQLREYLHLAKCTRESLFADDTERKRLTFHDLRATGITWRIMRGDAHNLVQGAAGHKSFSTTEGYIRTTNLRGQGVGEPFPPIPGIVLGTSNEGKKSDTARGKAPSSSHKRGEAKTALPKDYPNPTQAIRKSSKLHKSEATPMGIETDDRTQNAGEMRRFGQREPSKATARNRSRAAIGHETDPISTALRAALDDAIAEGRTADAVALAGELAARAGSVKAPNVIAIASRQKRR